MSSKTLIFATLCLAKAFGLTQEEVELNAAGVVSVPRDEKCVWRGGDYGDTSMCLSDEVAVSSCGSGRDPDCENPNSNQDEYDMILCCPIDQYTYSGCLTLYGDHGESKSCLDTDNEFRNIILEGICGSGRDDDCNGHSHAITCCEGRFLNNERLYSAGDCQWGYADYGQPISCTGDEYAIFGRCGSGRDPDCDGSSDYHGIQCCRMFRA